MRLVENWLLERVLSRIEPGPDVVSDLTLSGGGGLAAVTGSADTSLDKPGKPLRPETKLSPGVVSSLVFLNAAFPTPLSAVCRNHEGSLAPKDAAIWSRDGSTSVVEELSPLVLLLVDTIDTGLLPSPPLERGRCCHDSVPERARLEALRAGKVEDVVESAVGAELCVADVLVFVLLPLPKPLKSGTSSAAGGDVAGSIVDGADGRGVIGGCESAGLVVVDKSSALKGVAGAFTGLIDFARSGWNMLVHHPTFNANPQCLPALRAALCCLPRSISSSNFRYLSASSLSRFSDSSRTDFKNAAGSRSLSSARCEADFEAAAGEPGF